MEKSEKIDKLALALSVANASVTHAKKTADNPHFRSKYASLPTVIDSYRDVYLANGLVVVQLLDDGNLLTMLTHTSGQFISSSTPIERDKPTIQAFCSALTYLRRYTLQALTGLASEADDDDGNAACPKPDSSTTKTGTW